MTTTATAATSARPATPIRPVTLGRAVRVELRKMFDTRSGFWLIASIAITGLMATVATVAFAPDDQLTYYTFAKAVGFPVTVILPMVALLAITSEWSQRSGLTTFTLVPNRRRVVNAKIAASVAVAVASMAYAFVVGAAGCLVGSAFAGVSPEWDLSVGHALTIVLGNLTCLLTGTMLGMLLRRSAGGLVVYFVYTLLVPNLSALLATSQDWYRHAQPWVDLNFAQSFLFQGMHTGAQWAHIAATVALWIVLPGLAGLRIVVRSEVK